MKWEFSGLDRVLDLLTESVNCVLKEADSNRRDRLYTVYFALAIVDAYLSFIDEYLLIIKRSKPGGGREMYINNIVSTLSNLEQFLADFSIWIREDRFWQNLLSESSSEYIDFLLHIKQVQHRYEPCSFPAYSLIAFKSSYHGHRFYDSKSPSIELLEAFADHAQVFRISVRELVGRLEHNVEDVLLGDRLKSISIRGRVAFATIIIESEISRLNIQSKELRDVVALFWSFAESHLGDWDDEWRSHDGLDSIIDEHRNKAKSGSAQQKTTLIPEHVAQICLDTLNIAIDEMYGAPQSYSPHTYQHLLFVMFRASSFGGRLPDLAPFQKSLFTEDGGWGLPRKRSFFDLG